MEDSIDAAVVHQYEHETWTRCAATYLDHFAGLTRETIALLRDAANIQAGTTVLDVRRATEHEEGHGPGACIIAHTRVMPRLDEVPEGDTLLVHCQSGNRASAAVSFLERKGFRVEAIDDSFENWDAEAPPVPARAVAQS